MIVKVMNNKDKELTYRELNKKCKEAFNKKNYETIIFLSYSMIEDRLKSFFHYLYLFDKDNLAKNQTLNNEINKIIKPIVDSKSKTIYKSLDVTNIGKKIEVLKIFNDKNLAYHPYIFDCFKIIDFNIGVGKFNDFLDNLLEWLNERNKLTHAMFNQNIDSINQNIIDIAQIGYNLSNTIKKYTNMIKTNNHQISVREKWDAISSISKSFGTSPIYPYEVNDPFILNFDIINPKFTPSENMNFDVINEIITWDDPQPLYQDGVEGFYSCTIDSLLKTGSFIKSLKIYCNESETFKYLIESKYLNEKIKFDEHEYEYDIHIYNNFQKILYDLYKNNVIGDLNSLNVKDIFKLIKLNPKLYFQLNDDYKSNNKILELVLSTSLKDFLIICKNDPKFITGEIYLKALNLEPPAFITCIPKHLKLDVEYNKLLIEKSIKYLPYVCKEIITKELFDKFLEKYPYELYHFDSEIVNKYITVKQCVKVIKNENLNLFGYQYFSKSMLMSYLKKCNVDQKVFDKDVFKLVTNLKKYNYNIFSKIFMNHHKRKYNLCNIENEKLYSRIDILKNIPDDIDTNITRISLYDIETHKDINELSPNEIKKIILEYISTMYTGIDIDLYDNCKIFATGLNTNHLVDDMKKYHDEVYRASDGDYTLVYWDMLGGSTTTILYYSSKEIKKITKNKVEIGKSGIYKTNSFYDFNDLIDELEQSKYDINYKIIDDEIQFPEIDNLTGVNKTFAILERRFIILRHLKTDSDDLAKMVFSTLINKDGNFIPYIKRMVENYSLTDYLNKIEELFKNKNCVDYYYIIGSILELIYKKDYELYVKLVDKNKYFNYVNYFVQSLSFDDSYCIYLKRPDNKYKVKIKDRKKYQLMDTCIKIFNYYMLNGEYSLAEKYILKAINYFPYSFKPYVLKKQLYDIIGKHFDITDVILNKKLKSVSNDLYGFEDMSYNEFINILKKI